MKAFIFDMDNTLVATEKLHEEAMEKTFQLYGANINLSNYKNLSGAKQIERMDAIAKDIGLHLTQAEFIDAYSRYDKVCASLKDRGELLPEHQDYRHIRRFGRKRIICYDHLSGRAKREALEELDDQRKMVFCYLLFQKGLEVLPGVVSFLQQSNLPKALASSSSQVEILKTLAKAGLRTQEKSYFDVLASGYEVEKGKPEPDVFLLAAERLKVDPKDCLVFEDSRNGVLAAKKAQMKCVAIPMKGAGEDVSLADLVVESFEEVSLDKLKVLY